MNAEILDDGAAVMFLKEYGSRPVSDLPGIIKDARKALEDVEYDTLVGRGSSGMLVVPVLAHLLDKNYLIVRKQEEVETSHDSSALFLGTLGRRWVFVDDFISSGETFRRTRDAVREAERIARLPQTNFTWGLPGEAPTKTTTTYDFRTELVGYYTYQRDHWHPWTKDARPGFIDFALEDTPAWADIQEQREIRRRVDRVTAERLASAPGAKPESNLAPLKGCGSKLCLCFDCNPIRPRRTLAEVREEVTAQ